MCELVEILSVFISWNTLVVGAVCEAVLLSSVPGVDGDVFTAAIAVELAVDNGEGTAATGAAECESAVLDSVTVGLAAVLTWCT